MSEDILIVFHIVGVALGVGGATVSDALFFKAVKDGVINQIEFAFLNVASKIVMLGLLTLFLSGGTVLFLEYSEGELEHLQDPRMLAHFTIFTILFINAFVLHKKVFPLIKSSINKPIKSDKHILKKSYIALTAGAVSIVSWYFNLFLGSFHDIELSYLSIMLIYIFILSGAIFISNVFGRIFLKKL